MALMQNISKVAAASLLGATIGCGPTVTEPPSFGNSVATSMTLATLQATPVLVAIAARSADASEGVAISGGVIIPPLNVLGSPVQGSSSGTFGGALSQRGAEVTFTSPYGEFLFRGRVVGGALSGTIEGQNGVKPLSQIGADTYSISDILAGDTSLRLSSTREGQRRVFTGNLTVRGQNNLISGEIANGEIKLVVDLPSGPYQISGALR